MRKTRRTRKSLRFFTRFGGCVGGIVDRLICIERFERWYEMVSLEGQVFRSEFSRRTKEML